MDTAQKGNDYSAGRRIPGSLILTEKHVGQQNSKARSWVWLQHVHNRLSGLCNLGSGNRSKNPMVNSIVEKQNFGRLNKDRDQRKQSAVYQHIDAG